MSIMYSSKIKDVRKLILRVQKIEIVCAFQTFLEELMYEKFDRETFIVCRLMNRTSCPVR